MQTYAEIISIAIPVFVVLVLIEFLISRRMHKDVIRSFDTVSSLSSGMTNVIKDVLGLVVLIVSYDWLESHISIYHIESTFWVYFWAFIGIDFVGYWSHRLEHEINVFWNRHIIHHSSEEFNLACALRQNISVFFSIFFFLYIPMAIIGIPGEVIATVAPLQLFLQFWYHTRLIDRMGWLEYIIVTPSHHRVHHAINPEYIDKNYAQIFILWDRMFGSFQEELDDVPPVYGVKKAVQTWNPLWINFQHVTQIAKDAWFTKNIWDKIRIWFMPTGWRPEDRIKADPIAFTENPYSQVKYDTPASLPFHIWAWAQLIIHLLFMMYMFNNLEAIGPYYSLLYGFFLIAGIGAYTSLMDRSPWSYFFTVVQLLFAIYFIIEWGGWFELNTAWTASIVFYFMLSLMANVYFMTRERLELVGI